MESAMDGVLFVCLCVGLVSNVDSFCPSDPMHGYWDEDTTKDRCILRSDAGYEPSGCHVIRYMYGKWKWNHDIPSCHKETPVWDMTRLVATVRVGVSTVLHAARTILLGVAKLLFLLRPVVGAAGVANWPMVHMLHVTYKVLPF
eukprot:XP_019930294.1 PREDICTED: uncharacterized protein LOC109621043 [Crassostrea gigas]